MAQELQVDCPTCTRITAHTVESVVGKNTAGKIDLSQFDIQLEGPDMAGHILKKAIDREGIVNVQCHMCETKQSIECHIIKK